MDGVYLITLANEDTDTVTVVYVYGWYQLQSFINHSQGWKYRLTITEVDDIQSVPEFLQDGDGTFDNPFSEN